MPCGSPQATKRDSAHIPVRVPQRHGNCRGAAIIDLAVFGFNEGAQALYEHIGYEITEQMCWETCPQPESSGCEHVVIRQAA